MMQPKTKSNVVRLPLFVRHQVSRVIHTRTCCRLRQVPADRLRYVYELDRRRHVHLCTCVYEIFGSGLADEEVRDRLFVDPFSLAVRQRPLQSQAECQR